MLAGMGIATMGTQNMPDRDVRQRLQAISAELANTGKSSRTSVRTLLSWFGFQRRGEWVIATVRRELRALGLRTNPDFADLDVGFDSFVEFAFDSFENDRQRSTVVQHEPSVQDEAPDRRATSAANAEPTGRRRAA